MKAIVTGSSGFIGSRLCHFLDEKDYRVIKIARTEKEDHQGGRRAGSCAGLFRTENGSAAFDRRVVISAPPGIPEMQI